MSTIAERRDVYNTKRWKNLREQVLLAAAYLCERCAKDGRRVPAELVHHLKPIREGGKPFDAENLEAICFACHGLKHVAISLPADREKWQAWLASFPCDGPSGLQRSIQ